MTVLIVDDNRLWARSARRALSPYQTRLAHTAQEAKKIAGEWQPSIVVTDVDLDDSELDGIKILPVLKVACPRARIIVTSGTYNESDKRRALQAGADLYMEKEGERGMTILRQMVEVARLLVPSVFVRVPARIH
jgi:two-component system, NtrC family, nitrogen regulation response regulator NtrX